MQTDAKKSLLAELGYDVLRGVAMGVAFIIPGFSGGSIAAILGIYEKLIGAIADIFKDFKKSILTLLPYGIGMVLGVLALLYPLRWALASYPIPTVSLFVGLTLGGLSTVTDKLDKRVKPSGIIACVIPLLLALSLSFLPARADVSLVELTLPEYGILFLVGLLGSSALVIPGISGSMLLLILGYYNPIIALITDHILLGKDVVASILPLIAVALGIATGFILISKIMKRLLVSHPIATYFAILGFILGSVPTVYISTAKDSGLTLISQLTLTDYIASPILLIAGIAISLLLVKFSSKKANN